MTKHSNAGWLWAPLFIAAMAAFASGQRLPRFDQYPAKAEKVEIHTAKVADTLIKQSFDEAAAARPNFAGRFVIAHWRHRRGPVTSGIMDAATGKIFLPRELAYQRVGVDCIHDVADMLIYRPDSDLLILNGVGVAETERLQAADTSGRAPGFTPACRTYYFSWNGRQLTLIKSVPYIDK